jgi:hypothetical protein
MYIEQTRNYSIYYQFRRLHYTVTESRRTRAQHTKLYPHFLTESHWQNQRHSLIWFPNQFWRRAQKHDLQMQHTK